MAIVTVPQFEWPPALALDNNTPVFLNSFAVNASGYKVAAILRAPKSGTIRKIGSRWATLTTPTDTDYRVETVSGRFPTGTLYGTNTNGTIASGSLVANAMNMATLTANAAVTANDLIALVAAPSGSPNMSASQMAGVRIQLPYQVSYNGSWAVINSGYPLWAIEYSDGSYYTTRGMFPVSGLNTHAFSSGSTPDEIGAKFKFPVAVRIVGGWVAVDLDNSASVVLYDSDGVTPLASSSSLTSDGRMFTTGCSPLYFSFPSSVTLQANTYYREVLQPGASNIAIYSWDTLSAEAMDQMPGGQDWHYTSAKDPSGVGSWTDLTTRSPIMGLLIDGIDVPAVVPMSRVFGGL